MYRRQRKHAYRQNPAVLEHLGYRWESSLRVQRRNYQRLLMVVYPPRESFFRRELRNLKGNTGLAVRREMYLVRILVIDADPHHIEIHHCAQLACEKPEEFLRRSDRDEGLRNAEEGFVSLSCRRTGPALVGVAHQYPRLRFDNISHLFSRLEAQNKPRPNSGCPQNTPGRTATSLSSKKQSPEPFGNPIGEELPTTRPGGRADCGIVSDKAVFQHQSLRQMHRPCRLCLANALEYSSQI